MKCTAVLLIGFLAILGSRAHPATLKEMYDKAPAAHGYDRYIELETGITYTGGLMIGRTFNRITAEFEGDECLDVRIRGNGAILDLRGEEICISYCKNRLDIDDCVILNGGIRFRGMNSSTFQEQPAGSVRYITFYRPEDYGVRLLGAGQDILIERNITAGTKDTGPDFNYLSGYPNDWLPTGVNYAFSAFQGVYGFPTARDNWSYHYDPAANADPIRHFGLLCEFG
jgi:hypothetical protein